MCENSLSNSGYMLFNSTHRYQVYTELQAAFWAMKIKTTDITKKLDAMWASLDEKDKVEWNAKAAETKKHD